MDRAAARARVWALIGVAASAFVALGCSGSQDGGTASNTGAHANGGSATGGIHSNGGTGGISGGQGGTLGGGGSGAGVGSETCGNGFDDDQDGKIDEGCTCTLGETQNCYPGSPELAGIGACTLGTQTCVKTTSGEVSPIEWGPCTGAGTPASEQCTGAQDEDCDGLVDCADPDCTVACTTPTCTPTATTEAAACSNGVDDDCDSLVDCSDPDCTTACNTPTCTPTSSTETGAQCSNGVDEDCDGQQDCTDLDCCGQPGCWYTNPNCSITTGAEICDGKDNDGDGRVDNGDVCKNFNGPCPPGAIRACDCYCGVHQKCDANGNWGPCKVDYSCAVTNVTQSSCGGGYCDFGACTWGWLDNQCVHHTDCPAGQICDLGSCINDPYTACP